MTCAESAAALILARSDPAALVARYVVWRHDGGGACEHPKRAVVRYLNRGEVDCMCMGCRKIWAENGEGDLA